MEVILTKEEQLVKEEVFTSNLLLAWLKTNFTLTDKRIVGHHPHTLFVLIPMGKKEITFPLKNIASVVSSTKFYFWRLIIGIFLAIFGLAAFQGSAVLGLVLILLAIALILNSYTATFIVTNNAGQAPVIELSILEKDKVAALVRDINHKIAEL